MGYKSFIGIDVGLTGALSVISNNGKKVEIYDMPVTKVKVGKTYRKKYDEREMASLMSLLSGDTVCCAIESQHSMPKQGVSSVFSLGYGYGILIGSLEYSDMYYTIVTPQKWKKYFGLKSDKSDSIKMALELYPDADIYLKKHHNRAESLLIAHWLKEENFRLPEKK